jgi:hypothetical protein
MVTATGILLGVVVFALAVAVAAAAARFETRPLFCVFRKKKLGWPAKPTFFGRGARYLFCFVPDFFVLRLREFYYFFPSVFTLAC